MEWYEARKGMRVYIGRDCPWHEKADHGVITQRGRFRAGVRLDNPLWDRMRVRIAYEHLTPAARGEIVMRLLCIHCALRAMVDGKEPPIFVETIAEHLARYHPNATAQASEREEVIRRIEELLRGMKF